MSSEPKQLSESLSRFLANLGAPPIDVMAELADRWSEVVGPALAEHTRPAQLIDAELLVVCTDSAWASQISWCTEQIKQQFQQLYPQVELHSVKAKVKSS